MVRVHILVAITFLGPRPGGAVVNHKDFNRTNNAPGNLEWVTQAENVRHSRRAGRGGGYFRIRRGEENGRAKLKAAQVVLIRRLSPQVSRRALATLCGVSTTLIRKILRGQLWVGNTAAKACVRKPAAKLTAVAIGEIRSALASGERQKAVAARHGVHQTTVSRIGRIGGAA